jgi:hypothetical protein
MLHRAIATHRESPRPHRGLGNQRVQTLALIVVAMVSARTINLSHLAAEPPGSALVASTCRHLRRCFQYVRVARDWAPRATSSAPGGQDGSPTDTWQNPGSEPVSTRSETSSDQTQSRQSTPGANQH